MARSDAASPPRPEESGGPAGVPGEGPLESAQRGGGGGFRRGGHLGRGPPPGLRPPARPRSSGRPRRRLNRKKLSPWPGASVPAPLAAAAAPQPGKTTAHFSLRPPRALPASRRPREPSPAGGGAERAGRPAFLSPRSSSPPQLARPPRGRLSLGPSQAPPFPGPGSWRGSFPGLWKFLGSPQSGLHLFALHRVPRPRLPSPPCALPLFLSLAALSPLSRGSRLATPPPRAPRP